MARKASPTVNTMLRVPREVHEALKAIAARETRSFNNLVVVALKEWLAHRSAK